MATPPVIRQRMKAEKMCAQPVRIDDAAKSIAEASRTGRRPKRSLKAPATDEPSRQPTSAQLVAQPMRWSEVRWKKTS